MKNHIGLFLIKQTENSCWGGLLLFSTGSDGCVKNKSNDLSGFGKGSSLADILLSFGRYYFYPAFSSMKREIPQLPQPAVRLEVRANVSPRHFLPVVGLYAACLSDCLSPCECVCVGVSKQSGELTGFQGKHDNPVSLCQRQVQGNAQRSSETSVCVLDVGNKDEEVKKKDDMS